MRILFIEIRRSPCLLAFPFLVAASVGLVWQDIDFWMGDWHATSIKVQLSNLLLGPFVSVCAAWAAGRESRHGHGSLATTMPRPPGGPVIVQWLAVAFWGLLAYGIGLGFAIFKTAPVAVAGNPWPSYIVLGAAALCSFSAVGYALGSLVGRRVVAPLAGVLIYGYFVILSFQGGWVSKFSLLSWSVLESPQYRLRTSVSAILLLWAVGIVVVALAAASTRRVPLKTRVQFLSLAALPAVSALFAAGLLGGGDLVQRTSLDSEVCRGDAPRVCVWPEHAKWADDAAEVAHDLSLALDGVVQFPNAIYEEGLPKAPSHGGPVVRINTIPVTQASFVSGFADGILPDAPPTCSNQEVKRFQRYVLIKAWMQMRGAGRLGPDVYTDGSKLQALLNLSPTEQKDWVRNNLPAATRCSEPLPPASQASQKLP